MNSEYKWRFPDNNCTSNNGLEDAGIETFAGDPDGGLAREICQNSIDANDKKGKPARVEFQKFVLKTTDIPGYEELKAEIQECFDYKGKDPKEGDSLSFILNSINKEEIECLRISDFNTTGLVGVEDDENDTPFYLLTKGSGTSGKTEGNGGSKGIGKYACFVASDLKTVFYSTKAYNQEKNREEVGYIGISRLRSRPILNESRKNLMTMGTGYYSTDDNHAPFHEELHLDPNFRRAEGEYGTDVYLIGYSSKEWMSNITYKVLEGFMAAIIYNGFEVRVGDQLINKDTISSIINSDLFKHKSPNDRRYIKAHYSLFESEGVQKKEYFIGGDSKISVYVKTYNQKNENEASKRCEFIRYPYMRIKKLGIQTLLPYSAMCIIDNNSLCEKLRSIEDPAHTDWQIDRLSKFDSAKKEIKNLRDEMVDTVRKAISECLLLDTGEKIDFEGASEYLPSDESEEGGNEAAVKEAFSTTPVKRVKPNLPKTSKSSEYGMGPQFSTGDPDGDESGVSFPSGNPDTPPTPNPSPKPAVDDEKKGGTTGTTPAIVRVPLGGMKYKTIYDEKKKCIDIKFVSKYCEEKCELALREVGLNDDRYEVEIISATIDGIPCEIEDGKVKNICIQEGSKHTISCVTNSEDRFASEVVLNAIR